MPAEVNAPELTVDIGVRLSKLTSVPNVGESPAPKKFGVPVVIVDALARCGKAHSAAQKHRNLLVIKILLLHLLGKCTNRFLQHDNNHATNTTAPAKRSGHCPSSSSIPSVSSHG